jgi:acyl carrier protein
MNQEIINKVKEITSKVLKDERILNSENFNFEYSENLDSVNRVAIITEIEEQFEVILKIREISSWNTVYELVEIVEKHLS